MGTIFLELKGGRVRTLIGGVTAVLCLLAPRSAAPHHLVPTHELQCGTTFPCPPQLQRRIDFWIEVFATWGDDKLIMHDSSHPERVFSLIESKSPCSRRRPARSIRRERDRLKKALRRVASTIGKDETKWSAEDRHLAALYPSNDPKEIRAAALRIRCQEGNRHRFEAGLKRYGGYRDMVTATLRDAGLPLDIQFLPFVESAYNPAAYSRVGAAGLWQIMPRTARTLGLKINGSIDERLDPEAATKAAARYLTDSRISLLPVARKHEPNVSDGDLNPFVITSYNYGVAGMKRAVGRFGPDFMLVLDKHRGRSFRVAVKNFYASFLAARYVARNARRWFEGLRVDPPLRYDRIVLSRAASAGRLADHFGIERAELERLNRSLTRHVWAGRRLVPSGFELKLPPRDGGWAAKRVALAELPPESYVSAPTRYKVRRGDTACVIARRHGVPCRELIDENGLGRRALIRVGQYLTIPGQIVTAGAAGEGEHLVRRGDTACGVARRYGVSCQKLIALNGLGSRATIYVGQVLQIPGARVATATASNGAYRVRRGDTACGIARRFGVSCPALISLNRLGRRATIYPGQTLTIPSG